MAGVAPDPGAAQAACPRVGQASLDIDTAGCPSVFDAPAAEARTEWALTTTSDAQGIEFPQASPFSFTVRVTEGATRRVLVVAGRLVITNSGQQHAKLSSVVANLQAKASRTKYITVASAVAVESEACRAGGVAPTCWNDLLPFRGAPGSSLTLLDPSSNDAIALADVLPVPPSTCANPTAIAYLAEFDLDAAGLRTGDSGRIEVLVTFASAGRRGGSRESVSCTVDANCNGSLEGDDPATCLVSEGETNNVRTVPTRASFTVPAPLPVCACVHLSAPEAYATVPDCVGLVGDFADVDVCRDVAGSEHPFTLAGTVSCVADGRGTDVTQTATLSCPDRQALVTGSPGSASFSVDCGRRPAIAPGDFCTYTQGGWGSRCPASRPAGQPGCIRDGFFTAAFPTPAGLVLGEPSLYTANWTTAAAVESFLPAGGPPSVLTASLTDPLVTSAGVLAGQVVALKLSVAFDDADALKSASPTPLGDLRLQSGAFAGLTVRQLLALADRVVGGDTGALDGYGAQIAELNEAADRINNCFDGCTSVCPFVAY